MNERSDSGRHYRVIRYNEHFGHGIMKDILAEDLTLDEAERLASEKRSESGGEYGVEDIVIQDQDIEGLESEVIAETRTDDTIDDRR